MKYDYQCPKCKKETTVERPMAQDADDHFCDDCGTLLKQVLGKPAEFIPSPGMYSYKGK